MVKFETLRLRGVCPDAGTVEQKYSIGGKVELLKLIFQSNPTTNIAGGNIRIALNTASSASIVTADAKDNILFDQQKLIADTSGAAVWPGRYEYDLNGLEINLDDYDGLFFQCYYSTNSGSLNYSAEIQYRRLVN